MKTVYGQVVIGPPGSGKTTYCNKASDFYNKKLDRPTAVVNLDPANDNVTDETKLDVMDLITVEDVMNNLNLGPNGALMYCMEYLETNIDWLLNRLKGLENYYLMFDFPGQVELYTHHSSIRNILETLERSNYALCAVHIVDSHFCSQPSKFISTLLLSLSTMLNIGLPHINVLSKADRLKKHPLHFGLEFYTEVLDLNYLLDILEEESPMPRFKKLNASLVGLIEDYSLVSFLLLDISSEKNLISIKNTVDKANGYIYGSGEERSIQSLLSCAVGARSEPERYDMESML